MKIINELQSLHGKFGDVDRSLGDKVGRLTRENEALASEVREGQEKLRLSASQTSRLMSDVNDFKQRYEQLVRENDVLKQERQRVLQ